MSIKIINRGRTEQTPKIFDKLLRSDVVIVCKNFAYFCIFFYIFLHIGGKR